MKIFPYYPFDRFQGSFLSRGSNGCVFDSRSGIIWGFRNKATSKGYKATTGTCDIRLHAYLSETRKNDGKELNLRGNIITELPMKCDSYGQGRSSTKILVHRRTKQKRKQSAITTPFPTLRPPAVGRSEINTPDDISDSPFIIITHGIIILVVGT